MHKSDAGGSDLGLVGVAIAPKQMVCPHPAGDIPGFGTAPPTFNPWQQHHGEDAERRAEVDTTVYGLVRLFELARRNNPNIVDVLFTPRRCIGHTTGVREHVRAYRRRFVHKGCGADCHRRLRGYAYSQLSKLRRGANRASRERQASIEAHGVRHQARLPHRAPGAGVRAAGGVRRGRARPRRCAVPLHPRRRVERGAHRRVVRGQGAQPRAAVRRIGAAATCERGGVAPAAAGVSGEDHGSLAAAVADATRHARLVRGLETLLAQHR